MAAIKTPQPTFAQATSTLAGLTLANGLAGLVAGAAALLRLTKLDTIPLSPAEAQHGLAVWQFWQPSGVLPTNIGSPAYFTFTSLLSQLLGTSDSVMRLLPALLGIALVLLPWGLRRQLGTLGALTASLLLAVSPLQTIAARTAGGEALALMAALLLFTAWVNYQTTQQRSWLTAAAVALALGLASAPLFYSALLSLAVAWLLQARLGPALAEPIVWPEKAVVRSTAVVGGAVLLASSTLFLWYPAGLGVVARLLGEWLGQFDWLANHTLDPFLVNGRYEPLLLVLLIPTIVWVSRRSEPIGSLLVYWLLTILCLMLFQGGEPSNALLVSLPGYLLLGLFTNYLFNVRPGTITWSLTGGIWLLGMLIFVNLGRFTRLAGLNTQSIATLWFAVTGVIIAALAIYMVWSWGEEWAAYQGTWLGLLLLFLFYQWGVGWNLAQQWGNDTRERWVQIATDDDVWLLAAMVQDLSQQASGSDIDLDLFSAVDSPVLRWYLRSLNKAQFGTAVPAGAQNQVIITPASQSSPSFGSDYLGTDFGLLRQEPQPPEVPSATPGIDLLRWWLFQETSARMPEERVIVWVRADVAQPQR